MEGIATLRSFTLWSLLAWQAVAQSSTTRSSSTSTSYNPYSATVAPSLSYCNHQCTLSDITIYTRFWTQTVTPVFVGTAVVVINTQKGITSTTTNYNNQTTEFMQSGTLVTLSRASSTKTAVVDGTTIAYPTQWVSRGPLLIYGSGVITTSSTTTCTTFNGALPLPSAKPLQTPSVAPDPIDPMGDTYMWDTKHGYITQYDEMMDTFYNDTLIAQVWSACSRQAAAPAELHSGAAALIATSTAYVSDSASPSTINSVPSTTSSVATTSTQFSAAPVVVSTSSAALPPTSSTISSPSTSSPQPQTTAIVSTKSVSVAAQPQTPQPQSSTTAQTLNTPAPDAKSSTSASTSQKPTASTSDQKPPATTSSQQPDTSVGSSVKPVESAATSTAAGCTGIACFISQGLSPQSTTSGTFQAASSTVSTSGGQLVQQSTALTSGGQPIQQSQQPTSVKVIPVSESAVQSTGANGATTVFYHCGTNTIAITGYSLQSGLVVAANSTGSATGGGSQATTQSSPAGASQASSTTSVTPKSAGHRLEYSAVLVLGALLAVAVL